MSLLPILVQREIEREGKSFGGAKWFLGIDLGTTNSTAALVDAEAVRRGDSLHAIHLVPVRQEVEQGITESPLLPSFVAQVRPGQWQVGLGARQALGKGLVKGRQIFYSTKSEMGLGREPFYPFAASKEFDCPYKVAARVLAELKMAVADYANEDALANLVITIPASFQLAARKDTIRAASLAGLSLSERGLFDEPNAALFDYLFTVAQERAVEQRIDLSSPRLVLVFDFGGGTCDISIARVQADAKEGRLSLANVAISRYERLGGDNIDTAIAEEILLPEFLKQNNLDALDLSWADKKNRILPQMIDVAEALKLGICAEYSTQLGLHLRNQVRRDEVVATQPSVSIEVPQYGPGGRVSYRPCTLTDPTLTLEQFDAVLQPFIDTDLLYTRDREFNTITSIFAPVEDVLQRASVKATAIDAVLLAGGSSLIPQVERALQAFFLSSVILKFPTAEQTQFAVARGAALQSFFLHGLGKPFIKPIAQETIGILTQRGGFVPLIPAGTELPYPSDGSYASYDELMVPRDLMRESEIVLAADSDNKVLGMEKLRFNVTPLAKEKIALRWRLDANKILTVKAWLPSAPDIECELTLENPLCSAGFQSGQHRRILELEQEMTDAVTRKVPLAETAETQKELARLYFDLQRCERAIDWAKGAMLAGGGPDVWMLNLMASAYAQLGALDRAEKSYREAVKTESRNSTLHFNLSTCLARQGRLQEALAEVERAIALVDPDDGAYIAHRADLLKRVGRGSDAEEAFQEAAKLLDASGLRFEYQRSWRVFVAEQLGDHATVTKLKEMQRFITRATLYSPENLPRGPDHMVLRG